MSYYIRTKNGELKAEVENSVACRIINLTNGHFRDAQCKTRNKKVFEIDGDYSWGNAGQVKLFLWTGDILEPTN